MAGYRQVNTGMWKDAWYEALLPSEKLLFVYLFTNDSTSIAGIYELSHRVMVNETGLSEAEVEAALIRFNADGKVLNEDGIVYVVNMSRYHSNASPKTRVRYLRDVANLPDCRLKEIFCRNEGIPFDTVSRTKMRYPWSIDTVSKNSLKVKEESESEFENKTEAEAEEQFVPANFEPDGLGEAAAAPPAAAAAPTAGKGFTSGSAVADRLLFLGTGMSAMPPSWNGHRAMIDEALRSIFEREGEERAVAAVREVFSEWKERGYRPTNPGWVDWLVGGIPAARASPGKGSEMSARDKIIARARGGK